MAIDLDSSISDELTTVSTDPKKTSSSHGKAVCGDCGADVHRKGGCLVQQATSSSCTSKTEDGVFYTETSSVPDGPEPLSVGQPGLETHDNPPKRKEDSGYKSLSLTAPPDTDQPHPEEPPHHEASPESAFVNHPQQDDLEHGLSPPAHPHTETAPPYNPQCFADLEENYFRKRGKTMLPAIKPFLPPDPGGGGI